MQKNLWAALAPENLVREFEQELDWRRIRPELVQDRLYLFSGEALPLFWAEVVWKEARREAIESIGDGARRLGRVGGIWAHFPTGRHHRRAALIADQIKSFRDREIEFPPAAAALADIGAFALLGEKEILWSKSFDRPHPFGAPRFREDKEGAPSRAYLKLWEVFTLQGEWPKAGDFCLDLGAAPGGWTWVLARLGAKVLCYDRALLDPKVASLENVEVREGDAFSVQPAEVGKVAWLFCDVIADPVKLWAFLQPWLPTKTRFVCTLKFQGQADLSVVAKFAAQGRILHLHQNKHELTFIR